MKAPGEIKGDTIWEEINSYREIINLPASKATMTIIADFIRSMINSSNEHMNVFSLRTGSGSMYKRMLNKELENGKMSVKGIEKDKKMYDRCIEGFPGKYAESHKFGNVPDGYSSIIEGGISNVHEVVENTIDIFETRFTLSGVFLRKQLIEIFEKIHGILKPKGTLILCDIDNWIGSYIEKKAEILGRYYSEIRIDLSKGAFICKKRKETENLILDKNNHGDKDAVKALIKSSIEPLKIEAEKTGKAGWEEIVNADIQNALKGRIWYRTRDEWKEIISSGFSNNVDFRILSPEDIRKKFNDVINNPFLIIATKRK